jgi:hypothetical protein
VRNDGLDKLKKSNDLIGIQTCDLPAEDILIPLKICCCFTLPEDILIKPPHCPRKLLNRCLKKPDSLLLKILLKLIVHFPQCSIDLKRNVLRIGTTGTETSFLSERELPECARLSSQTEEDVIGQSVREAEERDLARALQNSRELGW